MRRHKGGAGKLAVCFALIFGSPLIAFAAVKVMPMLGAAAAKAATFSAGITLGGNLPSKALESGESVVPESFDLPASKPDELEKIEDSAVLSGGYVGEFMPSAENEEAQVDDSQTGPKPYPASLETHSGTIVAMQYGVAEGTQFFSLDGGAQVRNTTSVPTEQLIAESKLLPEFKIKFNSEPQVLIMHTHTTESYEPYERDFYDASFNSRTTDESKNVVSVGNKIQEQLSAAGIGVIHDKTIHDYPSYNGSYDRSAVTVKKILAQYPSIKIVLDIHRDAIEKEDGTRVAPVVNIDGKNAAQVMIISGADNGKLNMPNYMKNFRFACLLQRQMESDYKGLTRPILFAYRKYNQDLTTGSILIEVGGHANSYEQAQYSGELIGKSLVNALEKIKED
ncbi:MAG: stage sporulation protein [Clostridiales bacterium]|jgi:stage II sporulation protein P|nr:spoIIP [Oscillospiraceae bacterium]MDN5377867.1 stage sporulation protein [Clostridiales bacterium]